MAAKLSKRMQATLRSLAVLAHERELRRLLDRLDADFSLWRRGEIDSFTLDDAVRGFVHGRSRHDLVGRYTSKILLPKMVARAIVAGILRPEDVSPEVVEALDQELSFFRRGLADGTISFDEEED